MTKNYDGNFRALLEEIWPKDESFEVHLDLGCGDFWWTLGLPGVKRITGIDIWQDVVDKAREKVADYPLPVLIYCTDLREFIRTQPDDYYGVVTLIDVYEHFEEDEARFILQQAERIAKKFIVVWTTLGYIEQAGVDPDGTPNPHQEHKYGPSVEDFEGWEVLTFPEWHGARGGAILAYKKI